jgi:hypothetical protein
MYWSLNIIRISSDLPRIVNVVADVAILALPIRYIFTLRLTVTRRIQVSGIFLLGALVCVFGIVRTVALSRAAEGDPSCVFRSISHS